MNVLSGVQEPVYKPEPYWAKNSGAMIDEDFQRTTTYPDIEQEQTRLENIETSWILVQNSHEDVVRWQAQIINGFEEAMSQHKREADAALDSIRKIFTMPDDPSVTTYLHEHRAIPQILLEAAPHLREHFGNAVFTLRAPIDDSGSQTLYAVVMWHGPVDDVGDALDRFDEVWWIHNARRASSYLTFTYELV